MLFRSSGLYGPHLDQVGKKSFALPTSVLLVSIPSLDSMDEYWERRYSQGGTSGLFLEKSREWKWKHILAHAGVMDTVIDVGCGDLRFWEDRNCEDYIGIDISQTIIEKDMRERPRWKFILQEAQTPIRGIGARVVLCLDVLFHILDESAYVRILENLCMYSKEWVFIFTWAKNPLDLIWRSKTLLFDVGAATLKKHPSRFSGFRDMIRFLSSQPDSDGVYQKYRDFTKYIWVLRSKGFALEASHAMPTRLDYYHISNALYVFRKS
jgi:hypothetical protein